MSVFRGINTNQASSLDATSTSNSDVISRYFVTKASWKGKYKRILCVMTNSICTQDPANLFLTNTWTFAGPDPDLTSIQLGGADGDELEFILTARPDKKSRAKPVKFTCAARGALLTDLYQAIARVAPSYLPAPSLEFPALKLKWSPGLGQSASQGRLQWHPVRLRVSCWGLECLDPTSGLLKWRVAYIHFGTPGIQCLASSGADANPPGQFAIHLRYGRCPRVFASDRRAEICSKVTQRVHAHVGCVFALGTQDRGSAGEVLDTWQSKERARALMPGESPWGEWTARKLREYVLHRENAALVERMLASGDASFTHASVKRLQVTATALIEKKIDSYETSTRYPLAAVARLVRFPDEPMKVAVEWTDATLLPAVYVVSDREALLCTLLDAAQQQAGRAVPVVPHLTERSDVIVGGGGGGVQADPEVEKLALHALGIACREAVDSRALVSVPILHTAPPGPEPAAASSAPLAGEGGDGAPEAAAAGVPGGGASRPPSPPPGQEGSAPSTSTAPAPREDRVLPGGVRIPRAMEQAVAQTVKRTVKQAKSLVQKSGLHEMLQQAQTAVDRGQLPFAKRATPEPAALRVQDESEPQPLALPPWATPGLARVVERAMEFNGSVGYGGVRPAAKVDEAVVAALFALLPALPERAAVSPSAVRGAVLDLDVNVARVCHVILGALVRLASSLGVASQIAQGASVYGPKICSMLLARDTGVVAEAARLLTRLWAPGPARSGALVWAHPSPGVPSSPLHSAEEAQAAKYSKQMLLAGRWTREGEGKRLTSVLFHSLRGAERRSVLDESDKSGSGSSGLIAPPLASLALTEAIAAAMCIPGALTTEPAALSELVASCSALGRALFALFQHPAKRVADSVAVIMTTVVAQGGGEVAAPLREAALKEGAFLLHLHQAVSSAGAVSAGGRQSLSQGLVALWADDYLPALAALKRIFPMGLIRFLTPTAAPKKPTPAEAEAAETATAAAAAAAVQVVRNPLNPRAVKVINAREEEAGVPTTATTTTGAAVPSAPSTSGRAPAPGVSAVLRLNWDAFFDQVGRDHGDAALIWNERTRQELRAALEDEINVIRIGRARLQNAPFTWNYAEFKVHYASIQKELCIGNVYVRHLMAAAVTAASTAAQYGSAAPARSEPSPAAAAAEEAAEAGEDTEVIIRPAVDKLSDPKGFFLSLYHHMLTSALDVSAVTAAAPTAPPPSQAAQARGREEEWVLCLQAMEAVYKAHAGLIGPFDGIPFFVALVDRTHSHPMRLALLRLLGALMGGSIQPTTRHLDRAVLAAAANLQALLECPEALEVLLHGAALLHVGGQERRGWEDLPEAERQWYVLRPAAAAEGAEEEDGSVVVEGRGLYRRTGPFTLPELDQQLRDGGGGGLDSAATLVAPRGRSDGAEGEASEPRPWQSIRTLRWLFARAAPTAGPGLLPAQATTALGEACWRLVAGAALSTSGSDNGSVLLPLPRAHRLLAGPRLLPHVCQLVLTMQPDYVASASAVLHCILLHNAAALSKLYATGWFYFALAYEKNNLGEIAALLQLAHAKQRFLGEGDTWIGNPAVPLPQRSFLGHLLPEALLHQLEKPTGAADFQRTFGAENVNPELIWTDDMRTAVLQPALRTHVAAFRAALRGNPALTWDFSLTAPVHYPQLKGEIWCHRYLLRALCDERRFPNWPVEAPLPFLQALLSAWRREEQRPPPDMTLADARALLELDASTSVTAGIDVEAMSTLSPGPAGRETEESLRRAYRRVCRKYHPDKNPSPDARDRFIRIQSAFERLLAALPSPDSPADAATATASHGDNDDDEGGPRAGVLDLLLQAQAIVYSRCRAQLAPYRYAGYPAVLSTALAALRAPALQQLLASRSAANDTAAPPQSEAASRLSRCMDLLWLTCCASPRNALELLRNQGLEAIQAVLVAALRALEGPTPAATAPLTGPDLASALATQALRTLAGVCAFPEALTEVAARPGIVPLVLSAALRDPGRHPALVDAALVCAVNMCQAADMQGALVRGGALAIALPLCLQFNATVTAPELRALLVGPGSQALDPGTGPLELLLGVDAAEGGEWGAADQSPRRALDRSQAPFYLGLLGFERGAAAAGQTLRAALAARLCAQLGGYLGGPCKTPENPTARSLLATLLTPSLEELLSVIDPRTFLLELTGTREEAHLIWTESMRAQLSAFLAQLRPQVEASLKAADPIASQSLPDFHQDCLGFRYRALADELRIAGVYVRIFKENPALFVRDVGEFATGLCRYAALHAMRRGVALGLEPASLASFLGIDSALATSFTTQPPRADPHLPPDAFRSVGEAQGDTWLQYTLTALRNLVLQAPKAAVFLAQAAALRPLLVLLEPVLRWGHARTAQEIQGGQETPARPLPSDLDIAHLALSLLAALTAHAGCLEALAAERTALTCLWLLHRPPSPLAAALALQILSALTGAGTTGTAVLHQGGLYFLLDFLLPPVGPPPSEDPLRPQRESACQVLSASLAAPAFRGPLQGLIDRLLPPGLAALFTEGPGDAAPLPALETPSETPERIWTPAMRARLTAELAALANRIRAQQVAALTKGPGAAALSPAAPQLTWAAPEGPARIVYPELAGEAVLAGVYVRLFLEDPRFPLRHPQRFLEALLEALVKEGAGRGDPQACVTFSAAVVALLRTQVTLGDHLVSVGYIAKLLALLSARAGPGAQPSSGSAAAQAPKPLDPLLGQSALALRSPDRARALPDAPALPPSSALQAARLSASSGVPADEVGGSVLRILHQVSERASAVEALSVATPPLIPALQGCMRWGVAGSLLALETLQRTLSAVNQARDVLVGQALRFGLVASLLAALEQSRPVGAVEGGAAAGTREEAATERVLIISILQLMAQEGPYEAQLQELLGASPVWGTVRDQRHDMYLPAGSAMAGAAGVVGLLAAGAVAQFALPAPEHGAGGALKLESGL